MVWLLPKQRAMGEDSHQHLKDDESLLLCIRCHQEDIPRLSVGCHHCHPKHTVLEGVQISSSEGTDCLSCHGSHQQPLHFGRHCGNCHQTESWQVSLQPGPEQMNCFQCHEPDSPYRHYGALNCLLCHSRSSWEQAEFEHTGIIACSRCHVRPARHRQGKCQFCHDTIDWGHAS